MNRTVLDVLHTTHLQPFPGHLTLGQILHQLDAIVHHSVVVVTSLNDVTRISFDAGVHQSALGCLQRQCSFGLVPTIVVDSFDHR